MHIIVIGYFKMLHMRKKNIKNKLLNITYNILVYILFEII